MSCDHIAAVRLVSRPGQRCRAARVVRFATRMRSRGNLVPPTICIKHLRLELTEFGNYPPNSTLPLTFFGTRSLSRPYKHRQLAPNRIPLFPLDKRAFTHQRRHKAGRPLALHVVVQIQPHSVRYSASDPVLGLR